LQKGLEDDQRVFMGLETFTPVHYRGKVWILSLSRVEL
jgi:hypothetical protein